MSRELRQSIAIMSCMGPHRSRKSRLILPRSPGDGARSSAAGCRTWLRSGRLVVGFSYASPYRTRSAYRFTVEDSSYLDHAEVGRGTGRALLGTLVEVCTKRGCRQMVAVIGGSDQWPSIGLHRALGFSWVGLLPAVGAKFGGWVDVVLMQRALGSGATTMPIRGGGDHG